MRYKVLVLGTLLACSVLGSVAMTLGRARGAAWIGQPLTLTVPMQLDSGQTATTLCPEADVFYAENKVEASRVTVAIEPTAQLDSVNLRIASTAIVDEPVVTVYLRAGCNQKTTRKFVFLADFPTETATPSVVAPPEPSQARPTLVNPEPSAAADSGVRAALPTSTPAATAKTNADRPRKTAVVPPAKQASARPAAPAATATAIAPEPAASRPAKAVPPVAPKAAESTRSRLKLDPLENLAERIKTLEATTSTVPLEEMVKDSQRIQQLQTDVKALLDQAAKNEASLLAMRLRMEKAESERVSMGIVWALGALVLVCLAAIAALWTRNRKTELSGWQQSVQEAAPSVHPAPAPLVVQPTPPAPPEPKPAEAPRTSSFNSTIQMEVDHPSMDVDVNLTDMDSDFSRLIAPAVTHPPTVVAGIRDSRPAEARLVHPDFYADGIIDVRQQAEFFEKLGKIDQAITVLEQRIRLSSKDSALLYLDLLHIAHAHNLKTDFRQFRDEFEQLFNINVPEFVLFSDAGRSLESYPSLMQHICQNWPTQAGLDMLEACLVRDPWEKNAEPFDLDAFTDLLMLHGVATRILKNPDKKSDGDGATDSQHIDIEM